MTKWGAKHCSDFSAVCKLLDFERFDFVYGHFPYRRYDYPDAHYCTVLRHPLARAISHFNYWKHQLPATNLIAQARHPSIAAIKSGELDFAGFIEECKIDRVYDQYFERQSTRHFYGVDFVEDWQKGTHRLVDRLGLDASQLKNLRQATTVDDIPQAHLDHAAHLLQDDIGWFDEQWAHWH